MATKAKTPKLEVVEMSKTVSDTAAETLKATAEQIKGKFDQALKAFGDVGSVSKETYEAFAASFNTSIKAMETVSTETATYAKKSAEDFVSASKAIMGAKSLKEVVDLQNDYAKSAFDGFLAYSNKVGELTVELTQEIFEPVSKQMTTVFKKYTTPMEA